MNTMFNYILWTEEPVPYVDVSTGETLIELEWQDQPVSRAEAVKAIREGHKRHLNVFCPWHYTRRKVHAEWDGNKLVVVDPLPVTLEELPF